MDSIERMQLCFFPKIISIHYYVFSRMFDLDLIPIVMSIILTIQHSNNYFLLAEW